MSSFIKDSKDGPFFLYAAFTLPHFSSKSEDKDQLAVPSTEAYAQKDWPEKAKKYAAMVHKLDHDVGRIIRLVDELGLREKPLIIFTSDNGGNKTVWQGFRTNGLLRGYKRDLFEGGVRVPFIARWPEKIPTGRLSNEIIAFQDMMPTFAELAGVKAPDRIDGISIVDGLQGGKLQNPHSHLYWDYGHCRNRYDQAVRMGNWKGLRLGQGSKIQLYDLTRDIRERNDGAES